MPWKSVGFDVLLRKKKLRDVFFKGGASIIELS